VKIHVNLNRDSIHLLRHEEEDEHHLYQLQFKYDASVPCNIRVYYIASETADENSKYIIEARHEVPTVYCEQGLGQMFILPHEHSFDVSLYKEDLATTAFPIVIALQTIADENNTQTQYTFASLLHCADDSYAIKAVQQKIQYMGQVYSVHDIYGLDHTGEREGEGSRECIVCLSEPRDTTVLPCRHMCLCHGCSELMRLQTNKCPICRAPVRSLLHVVLGKEGSSSSSTSSPSLQDGVGGEEETEDQLLSRRQREKEIHLSKEEVVS